MNCTLEKKFIKNLWCFIVYFLISNSYIKYYFHILFHCESILLVNHEFKLTVFYLSSTKHWFDLSKNSHCKHLIVKHLKFSKCWFNVVEGFIEIISSIKEVKTYKVLHFLHFKVKNETLICLHQIQNLINFQISFCCDEKLQKWLHIVKCFKISVENSENPVSRSE